MSEITELFAAFRAEQENGRDVVLSGLKRAACTSFPAGPGRVLHARLMASLAGADRGLEFLSGYPLDRLPELHRKLIKKKPPAPSVRRQTAIKRRVGKL